jgi:hypothetical protein
MKIDFNWTQEKKDLIAEKIESWILKHGSSATHGEGIMQNDDCQIDAPELIADLVDDIIKPIVSFDGDDD